MPHDMVDEPFDAVLECSGNKLAQESGLAQLKRAGTLVLVGAGISRPKFDPNRILLNELVITGAFIYDHDGFPRALDLLASGAMPTGPSRTVSESSLYRTRTASSKPKTKTFWRPRKSPIR